MQKLKTKALTVMLLMTMALAILPLVNASTGYIRINTVVPPSTPGQRVAAGGDVKLYFGGVTWSGGQLYLLISKDGFSQVSTGDLRFTPTFNLANVTANATSTYANVTAYPGTWDVGYNWINGTIARDIAGGNYFIKAFDGTATAVAVTDTYITIIASLEVVPDEGPGGASITLKGYAFIGNDKVNLTYWDPIKAEWVTIARLVSTDSLGRFNYSMSAPDLMQALPAGENTEDYDTITFKAVENSTANEYTADFDEWQRGLMQVDGVEASPGYLYGNLTDLTDDVEVGVFEEVIVAGKWFRPGSVSFLWDGVTTIGTTTANQTGFFNTTITIPETSVGAHNLTVKDATTKLFVTITVTPSLVLSPKKGPVGTVVTAKGYGFPAAVTGTAYNATLTWYGYEDFEIAWALTDSMGKFIATFTVPHDYGGEHDVEAVTNDTDETTATGVFTITPSLVVTPSVFKNNCQLLVKVVGTGFKTEDNSYGYTVNLDNQMFGMDPFGDGYPTSIYGNGTGDLSITFVGCGFRPGMHVVSFYGGYYGESISFLEPAAWVCFNVTAEGDPIADILMTWQPVILGINDGVATIKTDVGTIKVDVATIKGWQPTILEIKDGVATIKTDVGTLKADVSALKPVVTEIKDGVATVKTDLGTVKGKVESIDGNVATVKSDVGTLKADVSKVKTDVANVPGSIAGVTTPIWIAVILSLIAAIAAIVGVLQIRRKIAG